MTIRYTDQLTLAGFNSLVGSVGGCYDERSAKAISGLYRTEAIQKDSLWRGLNDGENAPLTWVEWVNNRRLLHPIVAWPPGEFGMMHHQQTKSRNVAWPR